MKERLQAIGQKLLANLDFAVLAVLGLLLLVVVGLHLMEQAQEETILPPPPAIPFAELFPSEDYDKVLENYMLVTPDITGDSTLRPLIEFNMFDLKSVKAQEELAREMDREVAEAERLIREGRRDEALARLRSVLDRKADHVRALDLLDQLAPEETPESTEETTPPE